MTYSVLVVDDSSFFRRHLTDIINENPELRVIGDASNGKEAVEKAESLHPDIITMDYEMPMMNGVVAVRKIMEKSPTAILMLSSLTFEGARITLDALDAGALDFLPKKFDEIAKHADGIKNEIHSRILSIARASKSKGRESKNIKTQISDPATKNIGAIKKSDSANIDRPVTKFGTQPLTADVNLVDCDVVLLGASTGGPMAIASILNKIPADFHLPIIVIQHMPESFTPEFAKRLDHQIAIKVKHAEDNDRLIPGQVLIAPGGMQVILTRDNPPRIRIIKGDDRVSYRPSLDITFASAANVLGKRTLAIVLTGMGSDGCDGAKLLKGCGASVWTQDEASSLIYGMPGSVVNAGMSDRVVTLDDMAATLLKATSYVAKPSKAI